MDGGQRQNGRAWHKTGNALFKDYFCGLLSLLMVQITAEKAAWGFVISSGRCPSQSRRRYSLCTNAQS